MATTTNYSWTTPDDTALVKDGAAAIRSLGTAIDTTVFNNAGASIAKTIVDAKGDIIAATAADTVSRLAVGANDTVLTADSSTGTGLKWAAPASGGMTLISTTTLTGASTVLSSIPQTYKHLLLILKDFRPSANGEDSFLKLNNTAVTLQVVGAKRVNGSTSVFHRENEIQISNSQGSGFTAYETSAAIWFYEYTSVNGGKAISACSAFLDFNGNTCAISTSGGHTANDTTAITSLGFNYGSGNIASGTALLYGVK